MTLSPAWRKLALTVHITASVGWLGAVLAYLGLAVIGVTSDDAQTVHAIYLALDAGGWALLVPLSIASLLSGIIQSLGTRWGLFRHHWVVAKLCINVVASIVLVLYMQTLSALADDAHIASGGLHDSGRLSPVLHAAGALILLLAATALSVYKPPGLTHHGQRKARQEASILATQAR